MLMKSIGTGAATYNRVVLVLVISLESSICIEFQKTHITVQKGGKANYKYRLQKLFEMLNKTPQDDRENEETKRNHQTILKILRMTICN